MAARVQRRRRCASAAPIDPSAAVVAPRNLPPGLHRQPDGTTCGPAALVMARHLSAATADPHELDDPAGFAERVRRTHRATNRGRDEHGRRQLPWPRALGTQPWALARQLGGGGRAYRVRIELRP